MKPGSRKLYRGGSSRGVDLRIELEDDCAAGRFQILPLEDSEVRFANPNLGALMKCLVKFSPFVVYDMGRVARKGCILFLGSAIFFYLWPMS